MNTLKYFFISAIAALSLVACDNDGDFLTVNAGDGTTLNGNSAEIVLDYDHADNRALTLYWGENGQLTLSNPLVAAPDNAIINSIQFGIKITLPLNCETKKLRRGKRFLIGIEEDKPNAFKLTNRNVIISNYSQDLSGETGVLTLTLMQDQLELEKGDRPDLMIANYFEVEDNKTVDKDTSDGYRCEITYKGSPNVRCGGSFKKFTATFYDSNDNQVEGFSPTWSITSLPEFEDKIYTQILPYEPDSIQVEVADFPAMVGSTFKIVATVEIEGKSCEGELNVRVVNII